MRWDETESDGMKWNCTREMFATNWNQIKRNQSTVHTNIIELEGKINKIYTKIKKISHTSPLVHKETTTTEYLKEKKLFL